MAMTASAQFEIRSTVFGAGTGGVWISPSHIEGLGIPEPKSNDVSLYGSAGAEGNPEYASVRVIKIPITIKSTSEDDALTLLQNVWSAWRASSTDITLGIRLGTTTFTFTGRPRGSTDPDLEGIAAGLIELALRFDALDPAATVT